ncbi:low molecular weight protein-tyrosine-phosphatase [Streptomyces spectabilis]|uniref:protein-tyrosine-phosphatase n=1 Tax=Streptomyces spectabilis TaxID=68270 RepID=A0A5P2XCB1_STRST|nr:low molecular weight protein-tyrosine-phosphatase [Streptomyces spectabilis]MBB5103991.1 protein-tyrosine phosphatase [Streptomyces spectabilis]MCI3903774.1 low molecular weight phosphotyrosine protein phosphatase [Streptomyces spectabilis]QEV60949.1 low molecular weight phosphotyrosine protein phosphatase [Streptomyces spectabilis]GGV40315.1 low molecular weight protein-tyrosine-phosphatase [Streptomyces spectabilis]
MASSAPSSRPATAPFSVCFVCTGNICRSPMAESVFRALVRDADLDGLVLVDSAGTDGWHEGDEADPRTVAVLASAGFDTAHAARQFQAGWFARLDLVVALDRGHQRALRRLARTPQDADKVRLLRSFDPSAVAAGDLDVPDPYYGDFVGFEECLKMVEAACEGLLDVVRDTVEGRPE